MKTTFLAVKPKNHPFPIFSWLIRLIQGTNYSHTASTCEYINGILDATSVGVRINDWSDFFSRYTIVKSWHKELDMTYDEFFEFYIKYSSRKYAYMQNIGYILKLLKITKYNPFGREGKKVNCSELQSLLIEAGGYDIGDSDEYDLIEFEDLLERVKE